MLSLYHKLRHPLSRQAGQGMVEYAFILILVSTIVVIVLVTMGTQVRNMFSNVVSNFKKF